MAALLKINQELFSIFLVTILQQQLSKIFQENESIVVCVHLT